MTYLPDLDRLLTVGSEYVDERATYVIERHRLDDVVLSTGRVVACDPLTVREVTPFPVDVAPGRYPLWAWVAAVRPHGADPVPLLAALQLEVLREHPAAGRSRSWRGRTRAPTSSPSPPGDGIYPTFIGRTPGGDVTSFVTELLVVPAEGSGPV